MKKLRVGIAHRSVCVGDAIGNDIMGSYLLLEKLGFIPEIVCEFFDEKILPNFRRSINLSTVRINDSYDLLIYHHSIYWPDGEKIVNEFSGSIVIKYHNITPAEFFAPWSRNYEEACFNGREQTTRLVQSGKVSLYQSDSSFNAGDLASLGVGVSINAVVPPFNRIHEWSRVCHYADYGPEQKIELLFVGRRAPNKGHRHMLRIVSSYVRIYSCNIKLRIVGSADDELTRYSNELMALADQLGVTSHVEWLSYISNQELDALFRSSHMYINASEHEGFCVPVIEAQAIGLPVVTVSSTALRETTGMNQIVCAPPVNEEDYDLMAGLVHEVATNSALRNSLVRHGFKNVYDRFSQEMIENQFIGSLEPIFRKLS